MTKFLFLYLAATLSLTGCTEKAPLSTSQNPLIVHEWGAITRHHFPDGKLPNKLNLLSREDELANFAHRFKPIYAKEFGGTDVTRRLVTPVIYFHGHDG